MFVKQEPVGRVKVLIIVVSVKTLSARLYARALGDAVKLYYHDKRPFVFSTRNHERILEILDQLINQKKDTFILTSSYQSVKGSSLVEKKDNYSPCSNTTSTRRNRI